MNIHLTVKRVLCGAPVSVPSYINQFQHQMKHQWVLYNVQRLLMHYSRVVFSVFDSCVVFSCSQSPGLHAVSPWVTPSGEGRRWPQTAAVSLPRSLHCVSLSRGLFGTMINTSQELLSNGWRYTLNPNILLKGSTQVRGLQRDYRNQMLHWT